MSVWVLGMREKSFCPPREIVCKRKLFSHIPIAYANTRPSGNSYWRNSRLLYRDAVNQILGPALECGRGRLGCLERAFVYKIFFSGQ